MRLNITAVVLRMKWNTYVALCKNRCDAVSRGKLHLVLRRYCKMKFLLNFVFILVCASLFWKKLKRFTHIISGKVFLVSNWSISLRQRRGFDFARNVIWISVSVVGWMVLDEPLTCDVQTIRVISQLGDELATFRALRQLISM